LIVTGQQWPKGEGKAPANSIGCAMTALFVQLTFCGFRSRHTVTALRCNCTSPVPIPAAPTVVYPAFTLRVARGHTSGQAPPYEKWFKGRSH